MRSRCVAPRGSVRRTELQDSQSRDLNNLKWIGFRNNDSNGWHFSSKSFCELDTALITVSDKTLDLGTNLFDIESCGKKWSHDILNACDKDLAQI